MISTEKALASYLTGACIVWAGIFLAVAVMLPEHFAQLLPILAGGMVWFIVLVPPLFRSPPRERAARSSPGPTTEGTERSPS